ncbi:MAG: homocysteine S-methyltransferase [Saprospiraceae bacterium]|nr:homocysteine S-methyltransferase [Saprospiraceae bacterium]
MRKMENPLNSILRRQGFVMLDGGLATELESRGAELDAQLWSASLLLDRPELIQQLHFDYYEAGADVSITATYQATFEGFAQKGIGRRQCEELMRRAIHLAASARDEFWESKKPGARCRPLVAASVGPYGAYLADGSEYRGDYGLSVSQLMDFHRPRLEVLVQSNPDLLACETIPSRKEAEALLRSLEDFPGVSAWMSFSCCDATRTCGGDPFAECMEMVLASSQIVAAGLNCTPPGYVTSLLNSVPETVRPLLAYPNSGEIWDAENRCWQPDPRSASPAKDAVNWYEAGARIIGGCCRTAPRDIEAMRKGLVDLVGE